MKKIFIYYSLSNNGDVVAEAFKDKGYEIRKVVSKAKYPKNKLGLMITGGFKATFNKKDQLLDFDSDISEFDKVVIASPIWNDRLSAPINGVLDTLNLQDKDLAFVLYSASGNANKAKEKIKNLYDVDAVVLKEPKKYKEELKKLEDM